MAVVSGSSKVFGQPGSSPPHWLYTVTVTGYWTLELFVVKSLAPTTALPSLSMAGEKLLQFGAWVPCARACTGSDSTNKASKGINPLSQFAPVHHGGRIIVVFIFFMSSGFGFKNQSVVIDLIGLNN